MKRIKNMCLSWTIHADNLTPQRKIKSHIFQATKMLDRKSGKQMKHYSPCMIPASTIWWATTFCGEHRRRLSAISGSSETTSVARSKKDAPLRWNISLSSEAIFAIASKESRTLSMLTCSAGSKAVKAVSRVICACVRVIFLYNMRSIV